MLNKIKLALYELTDRTTNILFITSIFISTIIYLLHIITHFPFFDGTIHIRYLWLISSGYRANVDFFCIYPTLGYFLTLPYFNLFPESAFVLLALRLFSAANVALIGLTYYIHGRRISHDWIIALLPFLLISTDRSIGVFFSEYSIDHLAALVAIWAMTTILSEPRFGRLAFCTMLSVISLFIMPKYHFPLFFGLLGYAWDYYSETKKPYLAISGLLSGLFSAILVVAAIFWLVGGSLLNNFKYAYLFNFRFSSALDKQIGDSQLFDPVFMYVASFLRYHPLLSFSFLIGIVGWIRYANKGWRQPDHYIWGGCGILLGCIVSTLFDAIYCEQYITPVLLCMSLFVPFAFSETVVSEKIIKFTRLTLVIITFVILIVRLDHVADEFQLTPYNSRGKTPTSEKLLGEILMAPTGINILNEYDDLLEIIPEDEKIVAAWPYHPLFRRDLTFQIFDDRPSLSIGLIKSGPIIKTFSADTFKMALEQNPPALIVLNNLDEFYPPGWDSVAAEFISRHNDLYEKYSTRIFEGFIRKGLLE